ncbi:MAG: RNA methyltransferase [Sphingobacteriales bacterium]|jgi:TrmH family RNA methyltransferase|nr:RNA methyltransferase [Sphingobacteriales bacterium]MBP9142621.1 hypothetical protein [Chitinophagales bacterium]MDA0199596.1 RNA methyltransferase [Bacteroidota bacterium]MBK6891312.1 RNA methyltransferase [Sphingobacteriales bacterium]MBK7526857.1 RNA methyltransferase [Sphingobacteriales bacterium]
MSKLTIKTISSAQNPLIKTVMLLLDKSRERRREQVFVAEGMAEVKRAIEAGYEAQILIFADGNTDDAVIAETYHLANQYAPATDIELIKTTPTLFARLAYRGNVYNHILAVFKAKTHSLSQLPKPAKNWLGLVIEGVEKPGNIGAIMRTANAAQVNAVLLCTPQQHADVYHPHILRASLGGCFSLPIAICSTTEAINWLQQHNITSFAAALSGSVPHFEANFKTSCAIVLGAEHQGLSNEWLNNANHKIRIPMHGQVDSLNVSVSAAILVYEALRQRAA